MVRLMSLSSYPVFLSLTFYSSLFVGYGLCSLSTCMVHDQGPGDKEAGEGCGDSFHELGYLVRIFSTYGEDVMLIRKDIVPELLPLSNALTCRQC